MSAPSLVDLDANEALRILVAVEEHRLYRSKGRFQIDGEEPPDRRTREELRDRGLVVSIYGNDGYRITTTGKSALDYEIEDRVAAERADGPGGGPAGGGGP